MELNWLKDRITENYVLAEMLKQQEDNSVAVYQHKTLGKKLVVRQCRGDIAVYEKLKEFRDENICIVYDAAENNEVLLVLEEYIEGETLADILKIRLFSAKETCAIMRQICSGLHVLHTREIVHRDIKPENIILDRNCGNRAVIIDFNASRLFRRYSEKDTQVMGTIGYAPPEQFGEAQTDARSDIYATGILMNVMLTGQHPSKYLANGKLSRIIEKCIDPIPKRRFQTANELVKNL